MKPPLAQLDSAYRALEQAGLYQSFETFREYIDGMEGELAELAAENTRLKVNRTKLTQRLVRLRIALRKAHDAMFSWFSSEYASHPLSGEVSKALEDNPAQQEVK